MYGQPWFEKSFVEMPVPAHVSTKSTVGVVWPVAYCDAYTVGGLLRKQR